MRFGLHAETGRVGVWAGFNQACRKVIPPNRLSCCCGALRALASLRVCLPVCLHGETWLPSSMLQTCYMLVHLSHLIRNLVQLLVPSIETAVHSVEKVVHSFLLSIEYFLKESIYIRQRGFTRPELFLLGDGAFALRDSLALLP